MAQILLSQAGAALGGAIAPVSVSAFGFTASGAALGRTAGRLLGGVIDRAIFGEEIPEGPRIEGVHVMESREGAGIANVYGRMRVAGQVIWAARLKETRTERAVGGKGGPRVAEFDYSASFAVALGEGPVQRIDRVWANGQPTPLSTLPHRFYPGTEDQAPDPLIEAIEGAGCAPAYRGMAYLVFEDLPLGEFGNRLPQLSFEVSRTPPRVGDEPRLPDLVTGVNIIPASGEFVYSTDIISLRTIPGRDAPENANNADARADFLVSLDQLEADLPNVRSAALTVGWFGTDLRAGRCAIRPGVERREKETVPHDWRAGGERRGSAHLISRNAEGGVSYGGTPSDIGVVQALQQLFVRGIKRTMSPFLFMDVPPGNALADPYGGAEQAAFPWRGRIIPAAADGTAAAGAEIAAFLGSAQASDFELEGPEVAWRGADDEHGFRRFILHHAWLAKAAGGVEAFLIGSEMRGLTRVRDAEGRFPFVDGLRALAADVKSILGPATKVSYAADWSEYSSYVPSDGSGDVLFPLDSFWGDANVDFVGIDWYPPTGDWRDGEDHLDAQAGYSGADDPAYLASQMAGGEAYDWFYSSQADRDAQVRTPIVDTAHGEDWVFRAKDLANWHGSAHHERPGGVRAAAPTAWVPGSKPVRLSEIGFPAVDKGVNSPNLFYDPKSSESAVPPYSSGARDDLLQRRALEAALAHWAGAPFIEEALVWAWDGRPWPDFPARQDVWSDGANWAFGHWLNGRVGLSPLADLVSDILVRGGVEGDAAALEGLVEGFALSGVTSVRAALEPLRAAFGVDAVERDGGLVLQPRSSRPPVRLSAAGLAGGEALRARGLLDKAPGGVRLAYIDGFAAYEPATAWAAIAGGDRANVINAALPLSMGEIQAQALAETLLAERGAAETADLAVGPADLALEPGDRVSLDAAGAVWRIADSVEGVARRLALVEDVGSRIALRALSPPQPTDPAPVFGAPDLVLIDGPQVLAGAVPGVLAAAFADPWPGRVSVRGGADQAGLAERVVLDRPARIGRLTAALAPGPLGRWDRAAALEAAFAFGEPASAPASDALAGETLMLVEGAEGWEALAYSDAELIAPGAYRLTKLLRGLHGTVAAGAATGARCVLFDAAVGLAGLPASAIGTEVHWRATARGVEGPLTVQAYSNVAALAWSPVHLRFAPDAAGGGRLSWIRRGADIADTWNLPEAPNTGRFTVTLFSAGGAVLAAFDVEAPVLDLDAAALAGAARVSVAEIGPDGRRGAARRLDLPSSAG